MPDVVLISNGMNGGADEFKLIMRNINGKVSGLIPLGNVPNNNGKVLAPTGAWIALTVGVSITTPVSLSLGSDGPASNIAAIVSLAGLTQGNMAVIPFRQAYPYLLTGTAVALNITTAGVAAAAITLTLMIKGEWV